MTRSELGARVVEQSKFSLILFPSGSCCPPHFVPRTVWDHVQYRTYTEVIGSFTFLYCYVVSLLVNLRYFLLVGVGLGDLHAS